jgi:uncharacterized protein (TIGR03067 family)
MKAALLTLAAAACLAAGAGAQEKKDKKEDKAARLEKAIDELAKLAGSLGVKPLTKEQRTAAEPLQGAWAVSKLVYHGKPVAEAELKKRAVVIKGQVLVFTEDGEPMPVGAIFLKRIDAAKKPAELDLALFVHEHGRPIWCGIYEVEGKTLTVALGELENDDVTNEVGSKRPKSFKEGDKVVLVVLRKVE